MIGMSIRNYRIKSRIGGGGMANVFLAEEIRDGRVIREVAVKILHPALGNDDDYISRFESEARGAAGLNHPNIVTIHDFGSENGVYYIVMEYVRGGDLREVLKKQPWLPQELVLLLVEEIAVGLKALHDKNLVHRDLKPANILLSQDGHLKLGDLGLAKQFGGNVSHGLTAPGHILGTAYYMSPEQCVGERVDNRSDIFALGVTAYEMISGARPFAGDTYSQIVESLTTHMPPAVGTLVGCVSPEFEEVIDRMLAKDPARRPQTVDEILEALRACALTLPDPTGHIFNRREYIRTLTTDAPGLATRIWGESVKRFVQRGEYYRALGRERFHDAIGEFDRALGIDPNNAAARRGRAELIEATESDPPPPRRPDPPPPAAAAPSAPARGGTPGTPAVPPPAAPAAVTPGVTTTVRISPPRGAEEPALATTVGRIPPVAATPRAPRRPPLVALAGSGLAIVLALFLFLSRGSAPVTPPEGERLPMAKAPATVPAAVSVPPAGTPPTAGGAPPESARATASEPRPIVPDPRPPSQKDETPPLPVTGRVVLESLPPGARITTLAAPAGATNRRVATRRTLELAPGRWSFRFELPGHVSRDTALVVAAGERHALTLRLRPMPAPESTPPPPPRPRASSDAYVAVSISTPATLYLDDQLYDRRLSRSYLVRLIPNRPHKIQVKVPDGAGRTWTAITVAAGDTLQLRHTE